MLQTAIMLQMNSGADVSENLAAAEQLLAYCAEQWADRLPQALVVLPENFAMMGVGAAARYAVAESDGDGRIQQWLARQAANYQCYLVAGTVPLQAVAPRVYASCLVYGPEGQRVARYDKRHLFDVTVAAAESYQESDCFVPGHERVSFMAAGSRVGLSVCYDLRFPEHFRTTDVDVWVVPSAFTYATGEKHWRPLLQARAIENQCHVLGVNQCGHHADDRATWGHSVAFNDWGEMLAEADAEPQASLVRLDLTQQQQRRQSFPALQHKRIPT